MKIALVWFTLVLAATASSQTGPTSPASSASQIQTRVEAYLRDLYAWGPAYQVKIGTPAASPMNGLLKVSVAVTYRGQTDNATVYASQDGRFLIRGELSDMLSDPFADARAHLRPDGDPSIGPVDARVTVVVFSDFQCPHCRDLSATLKTIEPLYPQVRFVLKDFPLEQIHPWAMTAALAARCAYFQNPQAFWKVHDAIFDHQTDINPSNAWDKLLEFASQAALDLVAFRACMASDEAKQAVQANIADGTALHLISTPTVFVNGRPLISGAREVLEQSITYDISHTFHE